MAGRNCEVSGNRSKSALGLGNGGEMAGTQGSQVYEDTREMHLYLWCMCVILWPQNRAMLPMPRHGPCGVRCALPGQIGCLPFEFRHFEYCLGIPGLGFACSRCLRAIG